MAAKHFPSVRIRNTICSSWRTGHGQRLKSLSRILLMNGALTTTTTSSSLFFFIFLFLQISSREISLRGDRYEEVQNEIPDSRLKPDSIKIDFLIWKLVKGAIARRYGLDENNICKVNFNSRRSRPALAGHFNFLYFPS